MLKIVLANGGDTQKPDQEISLASSTYLKGRGEKKARLVLGANQVGKTPDEWGLKFEKDYRVQACERHLWEIGKKTKPIPTGILNVLHPREA